MPQTMPLKSMSTAEKIRALEELWEDLIRHSEDVPSPAWHADVLGARKRRAASGASKFTDWSLAKRRIRERVR